MKKFFAILLTCAMFLPLLTACSSLQIGEVEVDAYVAEGEAAEVATTTTTTPGVTSDFPTFRTELDANADKWDGSSSSEPTTDADKDGYIDITSAAEFDYFVHTLIAGISTSTVGMTEAKYELMIDLDLTAKNWTSPNSECFFGGEFNGNGHVIKYRHTLTSGGRGLFGSIGGSAEIKNVSVIGTMTNSATATGKNRVGSVIARVKTVAGETAKVSNVYSCVEWKVTASTTDKTIVAVTRAGGLIGQVEGDGNLEVAKCQSANHGEVNGATYGGIINCVDAAASITVSNCKVTGNMECAGAGNGGIIGELQEVTGAVLIEKCTVSASVTGKGNNTAGIIGYVNNKATTTNENAALIIQRCEVSGAISGSGKRTGGVIGYAQYVPVEILIDDCTVKGRISGGTEKTAGIVAATLNTSEKITIQNCNVSSEITGATQTAGVLGQLRDSSGTIVADVTIKNCVVSGKITATTMSGGILGYIDKELSGLTISGCTVSGSFTGSRTTGGIAGTINMINAATIENCLVTATLTFTLTDTKNNAVGGLVGKLQNAATINNCHVNSTMTVTHTPSGDGKTTDDVVSGAAGLVGRVFNGEVADLSVSITNCSVAGNFTFTDTATDSYTLNYGRFVGSCGLKTDATVAAPSITFGANNVDTLLTVTATGTVDNGSAGTEGSQAIDATFTGSVPSINRLGYQTRPNAGEDGVTGTDDDTYDIRFVFEAKDLFTGYGVIAEISYLDGTTLKTSPAVTAYAKEIYASVKDENNKEYTPTEGYDYLYTLILADVPANITADAQNLQVILKTFGATKPAEEVITTPSGIQVYGAIAEAAE